MSRSADTRRWFTPLLFLSFFVSGVAGLGYQVVWARYFALFIGGSAYAHTIVLASFMGGLALGNALFGRLADRVRDRLLLYALLELGVGASCLVFPEMFGLLGEGYLSVARESGFASPANLPLKLALSAVSVLVPTVLMGGTLPVLSRFVVRRMGEVGRKVGQLYFINTGGAVLGCLLCGFLLLPELGMAMTMRGFAVFNLAIGLLFLILRRVAPAEESDALGDSPEPAPALLYSRRQVRVVLVAIGLSGAVSMTYELVWIRLLSLVLGSSVHSFTIMLVTFIGGIALGGLIAGRLMDERPGARGHSAPIDPLRLFAWLEIGVFVAVLLLVPLYERLPFYFHVFASLFERSEASFTLYLATKVLICVALMLIPTVFIGMTLPLASRVVVQAVDRAGAGVGAAFSANTAGTLVGAVLAGLVLIPTLGLQDTLQAGMLVSAGIGIALLTQVEGMGRRRLIPLVGGLGAAVILATALLPAWDMGVLHAGLFRRKGLVAESYEELLTQRERLELLFAEDGPNTSVAVLRHREKGTLYLKVNGKTDAGTGGDMTTQQWLGHLGMFLQEDPREVLVIGLGSGITAGAALRHPIERLDQIEISPAVVRASRLFAEANGHIEDDPRYRLLVGDAKEFFKLEPARRYDVIVSEPSNPWISGVGNLFTVEYFEEALAHLSERGLLVQWIHLYEMSDEVLRIVLDTLASVFPHVTVWQCNTADVLLVGARQPLALDAEEIGRRLARPEVFADLNRPELGLSVPAASSILALQMLSEKGFRAAYPGREPRNTDDRPILEHAAPKAFFLAREAEALFRLDERRRVREAKPGAGP